MATFTNHSHQNALLKSMLCLSRELARSRNVGPCASSNKPVLAPPEKLSGLITRGGQNLSLCGHACLKGHVFTPFWRVQEIPLPTMYHATSRAFQNWNKNSLSCPCFGPDLQRPDLNVRKNNHPSFFDAGVLALGGCMGLLDCVWLKGQMAKNGSNPYTCRYSNTSINR